MNAAVAADVGGVPSTNINHLTPRVLGIAAPYERTEARRTTMIDEIQGPGARLAGTPYDIDRLSAVIGMPVANPSRLYEAPQNASPAAAARAALGLQTTTTD